MDYMQYKYWNILMLLQQNSTVIWLTKQCRHNQLSLLVKKRVLRSRFKTKYTSLNVCVINSSHLKRKQLQHWHDMKPFQKIRNKYSSHAHAHRFAPPASGDTMIELRHSGIFSFIHFNTAGSAYKLSTGISKNPYREQPATILELYSKHPVDND